MLIEFAQSLLDKDILCAVGELTDLETFDFYNLTLYRSKPCEEITEAERLAEAANAAALRGMIPPSSNICGKYCCFFIAISDVVDRLTPFVEFCNDGVFCECPARLVQILGISEV